MGLDYCKWSFRCQATLNIVNGVQNSYVATVDIVNVAYLRLNRSVR